MYMLPHLYKANLAAATKIPWVSKWGDGGQKVQYIIFQHDLSPEIVKFWTEIS